jgi:hypothetical protein
MRLVANGNCLEFAIDRFNCLSNGILANAWEQPRDMTNGLPIDAPLSTIANTHKCSLRPIRTPVMGLSLLDTSNLSPTLNRSSLSCTPHTA